MGLLMLGGVGAKTLVELPLWARELVYGASVGRLGFVDDEDRPRVLPVTYAVHQGAIWSAVDRKPKRPGEPARVRYLRRRPDAALTIDLYSDDWAKLAWVQILGPVTVITIAEAPDAVSALVAKYEPYAYESPPGPLLRLEPERILCWRAADAQL
jgi:PPOX class probable F420-dependent enzyme